MSQENGKHCWRPTKIGAIKYRTNTAAIIYYLTHSHTLTQSEIARRVGCSAPRVNQVAMTLKREGKLNPEAAATPKRKRRS